MNKSYKKYFLVFMLLLCSFFCFAEKETMEFTLEDGQSFKMVLIKEKGFAVGVTEMTQPVYEAVMGENPGSFEGDNLPIECVSWDDAVYFCNKLSLLLGRTPVYSVNGSTDPDEWDYCPHGGSDIVIGEVQQDLTADGFRLPLESEWEYAARGGEKYKYAGSDNLDEIAWYYNNSNYVAHDVALKKPNGYGLYDMMGNAWEWCWDKASENSPYRIMKGGSLNSEKSLCTFKSRSRRYPMRNMPNYSYCNMGFRIYCTIPKE